LTLLESLAEFAEGLTYQSIPHQVRETAKDAILDTVGVTLAALNEPIVKVLREFSTLHGAVSAKHLASTAQGMQPFATVIGLDLRAPVSVAALLNSSLAHALDFDDISDTMGGHPSVPMLPAALAVAETVNASGKDLIAAYVAGFEVETKIAKGLNFVHYEKGWHPTATFGIFGATAASAKLMNLGQSGISRSLAIACSMSAGIKGNFGTMMKPFQVGQAAQRGVMASQAASAGMTASLQAFEGPQGFADVYNGVDQHNLETIVESLARPWELEDPGLVIKQYPCCGSTHPAVDAALSLRQEHEIAPNDVERVEVWLHPRRLKHTNRPDPLSGLECKFSVQFAVAAAILHGEVRLGHFMEDVLFEPSVRSLLSRTSAGPLPESRWGPAHFAGEVAIYLRDGRRLFRRVEKAKGRGTKLSLSRQEIDDKFMDCATTALAKDEAGALLSCLRNLEKTEDIAQLTPLVASSTGAALQQH
jgi:2-methylcitrate dehydratase PrpD